MHGHLNVKFWFMGWDLLVTEESSRPLEQVLYSSLKGLLRYFRSVAFCFNQFELETCHSQRVWRTHILQHVI